LRFDNLATAILVVLLLGITFYAGYGWRMLVERRLHNMPWLRKSARKTAMTAAHSARQPIVLRPSFAQAEPLERQILHENGPAQAFAGDGSASLPAEPASQGPLPRQVERRRRKSSRKKMSTGEVKTAN
jgi:hypothetical protein